MSNQRIHYQIGRNQKGGTRRAATHFTILDTIKASTKFFRVPITPGPITMNNTIYHPCPTPTDDLQDATETAYQTQRLQRRHQAHGTICSAQKYSSASTLATRGLIHATTKGDRYWCHHYCRHKSKKKGEKNSPSFPSMDGSIEFKGSPRSRPCITGHHDKWWSSYYYNTQAKSWNDDNCSPRHQLAHQALSNSKGSKIFSKEIIDSQCHGWGWQS